MSTPGSGTVSCSLSEVHAISWVVNTCWVSCSVCLENCSEQMHSLLDHLVLHAELLIAKGYTHHTTVPPIPCLWVVLPDYPQLPATEQVLMRQMNPLLLLVICNANKQTYKHCWWLETTELGAFLIQDRFRYLSPI